MQIRVAIQVRLWVIHGGALQVDPRGNIFLPGGPVKVASINNNQPKCAWSHQSRVYESQHQHLRLPLRNSR